MSIRISGLVDRLGTLRAERSAIEKEEREIRDTVEGLLHSRKLGRIHGETFTAFLETGERVDTSMDRIKAVFGEDAAARLGKKPTTIVKTVVRPAVAAVA